jgi:hypothetical protein
VALLSWASVVTLDRCELIAHDGGRGGAGGRGGSGGAGRMGGKGGSAYVADAGFVIERAGSGGQGGMGGSGGPGAGADGGPSHAIVFHGIAPAKRGATMLGYGAGGPPGAGGSNSDVKAPDGMQGAAAPEVEVP